MKYYLHDSNSFNDEKITELYINFGYEGLGLFYTALEKLAMQEKPIKTNVLKSQLKVGKKLEKCWLFMENLGILSSNNGETFSKQLLNFSEKYQIKKEKNKEKIKQWRDNQLITENVTSYEQPCNTPKVNKSKVNKSKVNKIYNIDEAKPLSDYQLCLDFWLKEFHLNWTFNGTQGKALKSILIKISKIIIDTGNEATNENILNMFKAVCLKLPDWFKDKDLNVIDSKFNEILTQIKNKQNGKFTNTAESIFRKQS
jgi:hypothetical protein